MRVLVSIEDFESGCTIADFVAARSWKSPSVLKLLHVVELPVLSDSPESNLADRKLLEEQKNNGYELLSKIRDRFLEGLSDDICLRSTSASPDSNVDVEMEVVVGHPHHCILAAANEWNADLIVLGSHRKGCSLGSVSSSVAASSRCSVTVVRTYPHAERKRPTIFPSPSEVSTHE
ncbi:MAG: universal stress protein [Candidatus Obscuribacterales bacterium]|nr:universal stress protein [Candidatus Obscuribacterales bacterium]